MRTLTVTELKVNKRLKISMLSMSIATPCFLVRFSTVVVYLTEMNANVDIPNRSAAHGRCGS